KKELSPKGYFSGCRKRLVWTRAALYANNGWYERWCAHSRRWTWSRASRTADCTAHVLARDTPASALPAKAPVDNTAAVRAPARIKPARPTLVLETDDIGAMAINFRTPVIVPMTVGHRNLAAGSSGEAVEVTWAQTRIP